MKALLLNLPSPPGKNIERDFAGGYGVVGSRSRRRSYGHDCHKSVVLPPLLEAYAAATIENAGYEVLIIDSQLRGWSLPRLREQVMDGHFDLIVARPSLPSFEEDIQVLEDLRTAGSLTVAWGAVASVYADEIVRRGVDFVICGELERSLLELSNAISEKSELEEVSGLVCSRDGRMIRTRVPPPIKDLDSMPSPAYHLLDVGSYYDFGKIEIRKGGRGKRFFTVQSSRGCPYGCDYCPYIVEFGTQWRALSPRRTVDEIDTLVNDYSVEAIWFRDPTWNFDPGRTIAICREIVERKLEVVWRAEMRADLVTTELAIAMKAAGCVNAQVGLETGKESLLASRGKKGSGLGMIEKGFAELSSASIPITANVMVGLPGDNWKAVRRTADVLDELRPYRVNVASIVPYPGTRMFEEMKARGWLTTDDRSRIASEYPAVSYEEFNADEIAFARKYLLDRDRPKEKFKRFFRSIRDLQFGQTYREMVWIVNERKVTKRIDEIEPEITTEVGT